MCVYSRTKFQVSSIILTSFRWGEVILPLPTSKRPLKSPPNLGLNLLKVIVLKEKHVRNSHQRCSVKIGALKKFAKLTGKHLCQGLLFNKVAGLSLVVFL